MSISALVRVVRIFHSFWLQNLTVIIYSVLGVNVPRLGSILKFSLKSFFFIMNLKSTSYNPIFLILNVYSLVSPTLTAPKSNKFSSLPKFKFILISNASAIILIGFNSYFTFIPSTSSHSNIIYLWNFYYFIATKDMSIIAFYVGFSSPSKFLTSNSSERFYVPSSLHLIGIAHILVTVNVLLALYLSSNLSKSNVSVSTSITGFSP